MQASLQNQPLSKHISLHTFHPHPSLWKPKNSQGFLVVFLHVFLHGVVALLNTFPYSVYIVTFVYKLSIFCIFHQFVYMPQFLYICHNFCIYVTIFVYMSQFCIYVTIFVYMSKYCINVTIFVYMSQFFICHNFVYMSKYCINVTFLYTVVKWLYTLLHCCVVALLRQSN